MKIFSAILFLVLSCEILLAQETNIVSYLKEIEAGNASVVAEQLPKLKSQFPDDPSVMFLDAILTENGDDAVVKYQKIYGSFPGSNYADAALYRIFSYYYSLGAYKSAEIHLNKLKNEYPESPYIQMAERKIPAEEESEINDQPAPVQEPEPEVKIDTVYNFTVQAGAFINYDNAARLKESLEKDGYESQLTSKEVGGSLLNVVTAGKFIERSDAVKFQEFLLQKYKLNGRIISLND